MHIYSEVVQNIYFLIKVGPNDGSGTCLNPLQVQKGTNDITNVRARTVKLPFDKSWK